VKPLVPATVPESEIVGTARGWLLLWEQGDLNTRLIVGAVTDHNEVLAILTDYCRKSMEGSVWINDKYQVVRREIAGGMVHLSIRRRDRSADHDWRDYQQIKNQLVGPECEAVELYPAESRLVDNANQYHLWAVLDPAYRFPIGWKERMVSNNAIGKSEQRPFEAAVD
jgi:hypothetical protein